MNLARFAKLAPVLLVLPLFAGCFENEPTTNGDTEPVGTQSQALIPFDFDNGDIVAEYVIGEIVPTLTKDYDPSDLPLVTYTTSSLVLGFFDAIAPYSPTMVGVYSRLPRRPASEGVTNRNRNIAVMHATLHVLRSVHPKHEARWRELLTNVGLDPDDQSTDLTTAVGIGNVAGKAVVDGRARDGFNRDGDEGGRKYHLEKYADYTGYEPVNSPFELKDPGRWQPKVVTQNTGIFRIQKFVTPQWAVTKPFSFKNANKYHSPKPKDSEWKGNPNGYRRQVDEVLEASANLDDYKKMKAELFNDKHASLGRGGDAIRRLHNMSMEEFIQYELALHVAYFDSGIVNWKEKRHHDAVRPFSAVRHVYGKKKIRAWGGPGKGTVNDITGDEWDSYLPVGDHPEYPSGTSCVCATFVQVSRLWTGSDAMNWDVPRPRGSSKIEPGITPATDITLSYPTLTDYENECGQSRVWAGVHFQASVDEGMALCRQFGDTAYDFVMQHVRGDVE